MSVVVPLPINLSVQLFSGLESSISYAEKKYGDNLEKLFRECAITGDKIQLTLTNEKVYISFTDMIPVPKDSNYLKTTPVMSGYKYPVSKELEITTEYYDIITGNTTNHANYNDLDVSIQKD